MALDKLVDSTQLDSDLTSVADAIRAKSGGSASLTFPAGFVSEIGNIPTGGGGGGDTGTLTADYGEVHWAIVTAGANSVTNCKLLEEYLFGLAGMSTYSIAFFLIVDEPEPFYNMIAGSDLTSGLGAAFGASGRKAYRYRSGAYTSVTATAAYDAALHVGMRYLCVWVTGGVPS